MVSSGEKVAVAKAACLHDLDPPSDRSSEVLAWAVAVV